jgi:hypothetical protein
MLELAKVNQVVQKEASAVLKRGAGVLRVDSEPTIDSWGHDALHVTIVLKRGSADKISGEDAFGILLKVGDALRKADEDRFPIISYVTEEELESSDDTEC